MEITDARQAASRSRTRFLITVSCSALLAGGLAPGDVSGSPQSVRSVSVAPATVSLAQGDSVRLTAQVRSRDGTLVQGRTVTWTSSSTAAAVSATGTVRGLRGGTATITAAVGSVRGRATISVTATATSSNPTTPITTAPVTTTPTTGTGTGLFAPNMPAGLTTVLDCDFNETWSGGSGTLGCGMAVTDWNRAAYPNDQCRIIADATSVSGGRVWESHYDNGAGGSGPCLLTKSLPAAYDTVYVAWLVKHSANYEINSTSMKVLYIDTDGADAMFEYMYSSESVNAMTSATGCNHLESNRASVPVKSPAESSPCQGQRNTVLTDGQWDQFEVLVSCTDGSITWWKNGELRASHTGRTMGCTNQLRFADTWGGGGTLSQEQSRYYDRILISRSAK